MNFIQLDHQMLNLDHVFRLRWKGGLTEDDGEELIVDLNTIIGEIPYISTNSLTFQGEEAAALWYFLQRTLAEQEYILRYCRRNILEAYRATRKGANQ